MKRDEATVYYDSVERRLVYLGMPADEEYWDRHWAETLDANAIKRADPFVVKWTKKFLPNGSSVVDAGCGIGNTVWGLDRSGFDAWGVDFAAETVNAIREVAPDLKIRQGDVREMPFSDAYFDGVWSLGVIEHFPEGYVKILDEMWRVLKPGGFAFVTVPSISPLRGLKARLGVYPAFRGDYSNFYQFVLLPRAVVDSFSERGWQFIGGTSRGGFKGLKDEAGSLRPALQWLYDLEARPARMIRAGLNRMLAPVSYHTRLYVFRRR